MTALKQEFLTLPEDRMLLPGRRFQTVNPVDPDEGSGPQMMVGAAAVVFEPITHFFLFSTSLVSLVSILRGS